MEDISPLTFTGSAVVIGYILSQTLSIEEQNAVGNYFMLLGQFMATYSSQAQVVESHEVKEKVSLDTIEKAISQIQEEIKKIKLREK